MRRWFELGFNGDNPIIPSYNFADPQLWYENSNRWGGRGAAMFVSMPFKFDLFAVIAQLSVVNFTSVDNRALLASLVPIDQGVDPAPDCVAQHLPREYSWTSGDNPELMPNVYQQLVGGFTVVNALGQIVGSTAPLFSLDSSPPTPD